MTPYEADRLSELLSVTERVTEAIGPASPMAAACFEFASHLRCGLAEDGPEARAA